jgi:hypothetical protein
LGRLGNVRLGNKCGQPIRKCFTEQVPEMRNLKEEDFKMKKGEMSFYQLAVFSNNVSSIVHSSGV